METNWPYWVVYVKWQIIDKGDDWWYVTELRADDKESAEEWAISEAKGNRWSEDDQDENVIEIWAEEVYGPYIKAV